MNEVPAPEPGESAAKAERAANPELVREAAEILPPPGGWRETDPSKGELDVVDGPPQPGELPAGVLPSRNYQQAVELGHVLAASGYFPDAKEPAMAAVRIMIGMDLGLSPTASLLGIHHFVEGSKPVFLIEGKMLGALIHQRPGYDYEIVERDEEKCTIKFLRDGEPCHPDVTYTIEDAQTAGLVAKDNWKKHPREMLTWRCLAEGQRIHFPEITAGQPIYAAEEFGEDGDSLRDALQPAGPVPLDDDEAEAKRQKAAEVYAELKAINPEKVPPGRFHSMVGNAEHSHAQLDGVISALEDLRDTEREIVEIIEQLQAKVDNLDLTADELKALVAKARRRGSNREVIEVLREGLGHVDGEPESTPDA